MGTVDQRFARDVRDRLELRRAVETGTYRGVTARSLAPLFDSVVTIELSASLHKRATVALSDLPQVEALHGHSVEILSSIASPDIPTLYFLDSHWSAGATDGVDDQCPTLDEVAAIGAGHPDDCLIIDDARMFTAAPSPPHDPGQWPAITEVFDAIRSLRPEHFLTLLGDQIIAIPQRAKPAINAYGARLDDTYYARYRARATSMRGFAIGALTAMRGRVAHRL